MLACCQVIAATVAHLFPFPRLRHTLCVMFPHISKGVGGNMDLGSLKDLYLDELGMLYDAEVQMIRTLQRLSEAARAADLRETLWMHCRETGLHLERSELSFTHRYERSPMRAVDGWG